MRRLQVFLLIACLLTLVLDAHGSIQVNSDAPGTLQNEVSLAINLFPSVPTTGTNLIMAYNDNIGAGVGLGISYSTDSGVSWSDTQLTVPNSPLGGMFGAIFDPISGSDTQGRLYAGYIAAGASGESGLFIEHSLDGGQTWSGALPAGPTQVVVNGLPGTPYRFTDKPHLKVDTSTSSLYTDRVYTAWIQDGGTGAAGDVLVGFSSDGGMTFSAPALINDNPNGLPNPDEANGPNVAVAPNGTVYVAWLDVDVTVQGAKPAMLMIDRSTDGGATFGMDVAVLPITSLPNNVNDASGATEVRTRSYPSIAADPNDATGQTVYMVYAADPGVTGDEADIFFIKSTDGGQNWSSPLRVNNDATINDQFAPWIAVKPDGTIDIVWYDKRNSANDDQWDVYMAVSTDGGNSFLSNQRVTNPSYSAAQSTGGEAWLGEYLGLDVAGGSAYIGFTSSYNDTLGDIFFDSVVNPNAIPEPASLAIWCLLLIGAGAWARRRRSRVNP